jgi:amino acid transporter
MEGMTRSKSGLDHKDRAATAWAHYRRLMWWMALAAAIAVACALAWLGSRGPMPLHMIIATIAGVGLTVLLGTALMGLVFLSAGTGHDDEVDRPGDSGR